MDILQVIKDEHRRILADLDALTPDSLGEPTKTRPVLRLIKFSLSLEINELYPELADSFNWFADYHVGVAPRHKAIESALKAFEAQSSLENLELLKDAIRGHFHQKESLLFPKIRQSVSTATREDLGELFSDLQQEAEFIESKAEATGRESAVV